MIFDEIPDRVSEEIPEGSLKKILKGFNKSQVKLIMQSFDE